MFALFVGICWLCGGAVLLVFWNVVLIVVVYLLSCVW